MTTLEGLIDEQLAPTRFVLLLLGIFAAVAMILTAVGLYGVISYTVRQRTAEIGVRMAFGAEKRHILKMVAGRGFGLTAFGLVLGVGGTLGLGRFVGRPPRKLHPHGFLGPYSSLTLGPMSLI